MSYQERAKNIFLKHGTGAGDLASVIMKSEDQVDLLAKQCVKMVYEILGAEACLKSWKEDEGADAARFAWLMNRAYSIQLNSGDMLASREGIDKAMEAANND